MRVPHGGDRPGRFPRSPPLPTPLTLPPPAERTHLFGSLMSNTDVSVTRTLMMSTVTGSGTMRPPKSPDLRPRRRNLARSVRRGT